MQAVAAAQSCVISPDASAYQQQLDVKADRVRQQFAAFSIPPLEVFASEPTHYRMRAEFRVWHEGEETHYIMFDHQAAGKEGSKRPARVKVADFPVGSHLVNQLMQLLLAQLRLHPVLRTKLYQVNFHTTLSGQAMVTLIYHKALGDDWRAAAEQLRAALAAAPACCVEHVTVIGRRRGQKVALPCDYVTERLQLGDRQLTYRQVEGAFSQPNAGICQHMLAWARSAVQAPAGGNTPSPPTEDLLELYCGNGNFTVALAPAFRRVVATEVAKASVAAARHNLEANGVDNVFLARLSSEEFAEAWRAERTFQRLEGLDLAQLQLTTILVDPPRAGCDDQTVDLMRQFANIVYISCNPDTLAANLAQLAGSHAVQRFALFDQFPYTDHIECGVYLQRR